LGHCAGCLLDVGPHGRARAAVLRRPPLGLAHRLLRRLGVGQLLELSSYSTKAGADLAASILAAVAESPVVSFRLALSQLNTTVGDIAGNRDRIIETIRCAEQLGAELVAFPELALTGYPPEDLLLKPSFIRDNLLAL